jgi:hypothetical protein
MPQTPSQQGDDIVIVEPRIIVSIPGRYFFPNRRGADGNRCEFACRVINISVNAVTLIAPVYPAKGELVIMSCDGFGRLKGSSTRAHDHGFVMSIAATNEERAKLAAKIVWYENNKNHDVSDGRKHKRIIPKDPHSILIFPDGRRLGCFVIDISVSGVAVSAKIKPEIGTPLAVGKLVGRVVRHRADGFAVQLIEPQDPNLLEQRIIPPLRPVRQRPSR